MVMYGDNLGLPGGSWHQPHPEVAGRLCVADLIAETGLGGCPWV